MIIIILMIPLELILTITYKYKKLINVDFPVEPKRIGHLFNSIISLFPILHLLVIGARNKICN